MNGIDNLVESEKKIINRFKYSLYGWVSVVLFTIAVLLVISMADNNLSSSYIIFSTVCLLVGVMLGFTIFSFIYEITIRELIKIKGDKNDGI